MPNAGQTQLLWNEICFSACRIFACYFPPNPLFHRLLENLEKVIIFIDHCPFWTEDQNKLLSIFLSSNISNVRDVKELHMEIDVSNIARSHTWAFSFFSRKRRKMSTGFTMTSLSTLHCDCFPTEQAFKHLETEQLPEYLPKYTECVEVVPKTTHNSINVFLSSLLQSFELQNVLCVYFDSAIRFSCFLIEEKTFNF